MTDIIILVGVCGGLYCVGYIGYLVFNAFVVRQIVTHKDMSNKKAASIAEIAAHSKPPKNTLQIYSVVRCLRNYERAD